MAIKVGVVGYGTIGKRVTDAVLLQNDMELVGVTGHSFNYRMRIANDNGIKIFTIGRIKKKFKQNGIKPAGNLEDLLKIVDVIVDCSPKPCGKENKDKYYLPNKVKAIFQGGEKASVADCSFVAQCNYGEAVNKDYVRVVSCNTTGMARTLHALDQAYGVKRARVTLIRRGTDPGEIKRGPINAIVPTFELPSHHGPDVRTVLPNIEVFTTAVVVPTTIMHMHNLSVRLKKEAKLEDVIELFRKTPRIRVIRDAEKINSTAAIIEMARDLGYKRGDMTDICIWEEGVGICQDELFYMQAVHQESDVIPENIDAIRAITGFKYADKSIEMTDNSLKL